MNNQSNKVLTSGYSCIKPCAGGARCACMAKKIAFPVEGEKRHGSVRLIKQSTKNGAASPHVAPESRKVGIMHALDRSCIAQLSSGSHPMRCTCFDSSCICTYVPSRKSSVNRKTAQVTRQRGFFASSSFLIGCFP
jgi:hypothetical protein